MNNALIVAEFTITSSQKSLSDMFDIDECIGVLVDSLMDTDGVDCDVWLALNTIQDCVDAARERALATPSAINGLTNGLNKLSTTTID